MSYSTMIYDDLYRLYICVEIGVSVCLHVTANINVNRLLKFNKYDYFVYVCVCRILQNVSYLSDMKWLRVVRDVNKFSKIRSPKWYGNDINPNETWITKPECVVKDNTDSWNCTDRKVFGQMYLVENRIKRLQITSLLIQWVIRTSFTNSVTSWL